MSVYPLTVPAHGIRAGHIIGGNVVRSKATLSMVDGPILSVGFTDGSHQTYGTGELVTITGRDCCPRCGLSPAYRRVLADPWDRHEVCTDCSFDYSVASVVNR